MVGAAMGYVLLRRRYGLLGFSSVAVTFTRVIWATATAGWACVAIMVITHHTVPDPRIEHLVTLTAGTLIGVTAFLLAAKAIGIPEVRNARALLAA
ncbi:hypothetical protein ACQPW1_18540 [Nocardia sp. CA-128927]|uniref:hypothetical protein n=1 Tax=Nocardia sp. CA-128927 TaxID=3239975 RepID=UPI003D9775B1